MIDIHAIIILTFSRDNLKLAFQIVWTAVMILVVIHVISVII